MPQLNHFTKLKKFRKFLTWFFNFFIDILPIIVPLFNVGHCAKSFAEQFSIVLQFQLSSNLQRKKFKKKSRKTNFLTITTFSLPFLVTSVSSLSSIRSAPHSSRSLRRPRDTIFMMIRTHCPIRGRVSMLKLKESIQCPSFAKKIIKVLKKIATKKALEISKGVVNNFRGINICMKNFSCWNYPRIGYEISDKRRDIASYYEFFLFFPSPLLPSSEKFIIFSQPPWLRSILVEKKSFLLWSMSNKWWKKFKNS